MPTEPKAYPTPLLATLIGAVTALLAVTGFVQLPIAKRYYLADIPLLGWLGDIYLTHWLHYLAAAVFLALTVYAAVTFALTGRRRLTAWGRIGVGAAAGLVITGAALVVRNLDGVVMDPVLIIALDLSHLGLTMMLLACAGMLLVFKRHWTMAAQPFMNAKGDR
jgi:hypothetical protein